MSNTDCSGVYCSPGRERELVWTGAIKAVPGWKLYNCRLALPGFGQRDSRLGGSSREVLISNNSCSGLNYWQVLRFLGTLSATSSDPFGDSKLTRRLMMWELRDLEIRNSPRDLEIFSWNINEIFSLSIPGPDGHARGDERLGAGGVSLPSPPPQSWTFSHGVLLREVPPLPIPLLNQASAVQYSTVQYNAL